VTDVVLKAFMAAAASQGDCNNLTFGAGGKNEKGTSASIWDEWALILTERLD
jgi:N-methylhydantoinase B/oxoprolinase/acetone carboxylase alpha subunit